MRAEIILYHLTCEQVDADEDPPQMMPESGHAHGDVLKFTCPLCHTKVTLYLMAKEDREGS